MIAHTSTSNQKRIVLVTPREKEILKLFAYEYTAKEIASILFISTNTVETHRKNLKTKFKVKNSIGMIRKSFEMGILPINKLVYQTEVPGYMAS